jgi:D-alanyl-D-alanine dipeptidase
MRSLMLGLVLSLAAGCTLTPKFDAPRPDGFVDVGAFIPDLVVEMRYAGRENFVGRPITGYEAPVCLLTRKAATALAGVQAELSAFGLGLKVFDCFRPTRAVADFANWARDISDQARKPDYYPNVDKTQLFALGYIAERSGHSRGSTVDLTVVDLGTKTEVDMGGTYDLFDARSWPTDQRVSPNQRASRLMLQATMHAHGFKPLNEEWWHFTLRDEPYPQTYFDFPVARQ